MVTSNIIIHRWWGGPDNPPDTKQAVIDTHPNATLIDHDDEWVDDGKVNPNDMWRHAANVLRYQWLYDKGGLWLDHDVTPLTDLTTLHEGPWTAGWLKGRDGAVMFFPEPGHQWLAQILSVIELLGSSDLSATEVSGKDLINCFDSKDLGIERRIWMTPRRGRLESVAIHEWRTARTKQDFLNGPDIMRRWH